MKAVNADTLIDVIKDMTIDIVRCKECKHKVFCYSEVHMTNRFQTTSIYKDIDFCSYGEREGEPQYDFGEYADRLWKIAYERGKREALEQTEPSCDTCKLKDTTEWCKRQEVCRAYQPKDEPQTDCPWK